MNHACDPALEHEWVVTETALRLRAVLTRDVEAGEELTMSYVRASARSKPAGAWDVLRKLRTAQRSEPSYGILLPAFRASEV